jgi:N-acyl-D-aspartate/D-glutamate deacylase
MGGSVNRRRFLEDGGKAALALAALRAPRVEAAPAFDLVVHGGTVLDGTGAAAFAADLGIVEDTISALDRIPPEQGRRALDARGLHVAPGFIPAAVQDEASFDDPHRYPSGIPHVLVNGVAVVEDGRHTGARPGRMLRRA